MIDQSGSSKTFATVLGALAILFWSSTVAVTRLLSVNLGVFRMGAIVFLTGGIVLSVLAAQKGIRRWLTSLPPGYLLACGVTFCINLIVTYTAVSLARTNDAVIVVGLINYLWPAMILVFSIPIQKNRPLWSFWPGVGLAVAGIVVVNASTGRLSWSGVIHSVDENALPYFLALVAAVSWGLFSNYSRVWGNRGAGNGVPLFFLASGIFMAIIFSLAPPHAAAWSRNVVLALIYQAVFPAVLGYAFWDIAMRRGHFIVVGALSYAIPLFSTAITVLLLRVHATVWIWLGCVMVIGGAVTCKYSLRPAAIGASGEM